MNDGIINGRLIFYCPGKEEALVIIVVSLPCTSYLCGALIAFYTKRQQPLPVNIAQGRANNKYPKNTSVPHNSANVWDGIANDKHHIKYKGQPENIERVEVS